MEFVFQDKTAELFVCGDGNSPLVVTPTFDHSGKDIFDAVRAICDKPFALLAVSNLDWNKDLSPWQAPPVWGGEDFQGGADDFLRQLRQTIVPRAIAGGGLSPHSVAVAGYSLAGLFAVYSAFRCDDFDGVVSVSGSAWYEGLEEFVQSGTFSPSVKVLYFSLGDKESRSKNAVVRTVGDKTQRIFDLLRPHVKAAKFEYNVGGHFSDEALRTAKGVAFYLQNV